MEGPKEEKQEEKQEEEKQEEKEEDLKEPQQRLVCRASPQMNLLTTVFRLRRELHRAEEQKTKVRSSRRWRRSTGILSETSCLCTERGGEGGAGSPLRSAERRREDVPAAEQTDAAAAGGGGQRARQGEWGGAGERRSW